MSFYCPIQVIETYRGGGGGGRGGYGGGGRGGYGGGGRGGYGGGGRGGYGGGRGGYGGYGGGYGGGGRGGNRIPLGHYGRHRNYQLYPTYYLPVNYGNYGNYGNFYDTDYTTQACLCQDDLLLNNTSMKISCPVTDQCGVWYPASSCNSCNPTIPSR